MQINSIYPAFDGEINVFGIGHPTIFVRTQGCHLRCYKTTKGELCDTPEALAFAGGKDMTVEEIMQDLQNIRATCGISKVTLSGGDPLKQDPEELKLLFARLCQEQFFCTVETSGTLSIAPYVMGNAFSSDRQYWGVYWVLDYKLPSAGLKEKMMGDTIANIGLLQGSDVLKFVIDDRVDYEAARTIYKTHRGRSSCLFAFGLTWGSKVHNLELFKWMVEDSMFIEQHRVKMNFQVHKLIINPDFKIAIPKDI